MRATIAMAPRAAGRVRDVSHAARAAARLGRGMNCLETERRASLMRSRRALGPAPSALIWHVWGGFQLWTTALYWGYKIRNLLEKLPLLALVTILWSLLALF